MGMKILILTFFFEIKESKITRGHNFTLVKKQSRLDVRKFSFSQRNINVWNKLSEECVGERGHNRTVRHVRTPLYRPGGIISGFEIVLHGVILPPFPPCDLASR